jgi:hypothetical protein
VALGERDLIRGVALDERGLIRGVALGERGLIRSNFYSLFCSEKMKDVLFN